MRKIHLSKKIKSLLSSGQLKLIENLNEGRRVLRVRAEESGGSWIYIFHINYKNITVRLDCKEFYQLQRLHYIDLFTESGIVGIGDPEDDHTE